MSGYEIGLYEDDRYGLCASRRFIIYYNVHRGGSRES
jgi:hypothetical protein